MRYSMTYAMTMACAALAAPMSERRPQNCANKEVAHGKTSTSHTHHKPDHPRFGLFLDKNSSNGTTIPCNTRTGPFHGQIGSNGTLVNRSDLEKRYRTETTHIHTSSDTTETHGYTTPNKVTETTKTKTSPSRGSGSTGTKTSHNKNTGAKNTNTKTSAAETTDEFGTSTGSDTGTTSGFYGSSSSSNNVGVLDGDFFTEESIMDELLTAHNTARALFDIPKMTWSSTLAQFAQTNTAGCGFKHTTHSLLSQQYFGENIASNTASTTGILTHMVLVQWYDEIQDYSFKDAVFLEGTGHFSQVVWKASTEVGCAVRNCPGQGGNFLKCDYSPAGNVKGEFTTNVLEPSNGEIHLF